MSATHKLPAVLSGGEKQRVAIARALANAPTLLLADEPTGSLHPDMKDDVMRRFQQLNSEHQVTIIMVTHDLKSLHDPDGRQRVDRIIDLTAELRTGGHRV